MRLSTRSCLAYLLLACSVILSGCPTPASLPGVNPVIQLGSPPPDTTSNGISLAVSDVNRSAIPAGIAIRLISSSTAPMFQESNLTWQCSFGSGSQTIGTPQNAPLAFSPAIPTNATSASALNIDSVVDPIAMTGCATVKKGWGPVFIRGFVRVKAVNSAGTTVSKTFTFDYQNVGALQ